MAEDSAQIESLNEAARREGEILARLKNALKNNRLVIVVGAGVTISATTDASGKPLSRTSWTGLIRNGLEYLVNEGYVNASNRRIKRAYDALADPDAESLLDAANILSSQLTQQGQLPTWLESVFGNLYQEVRHAAVLEVLKELHKRGATLLTTNYDDLLEQSCDLHRIGRSNRDEILKFKRGDVDGVFHVHGSYHDPNEVVLDTTDYYQVMHSDEVQNVLKTFLEYKTMLFVGCGSGLEDPNFDALLKWASERQQNIPNRHCLLIRTGDELDYKPLVRLKYGPNYQDLAPYLNRLLETRTAVETTPQGDSNWDMGDLQHVYESLEFPQMYERWDRIEEPHEQTFHWILPSKAIQSEQSSTGIDTSRYLDAEGGIASAQPSVSCNASRSSFQSDEQEQTASRFANWLETDDAPIFWISGKAASGKSTLMKYLNRRPELASIMSGRYAKGSHNLIQASFFFFDQGKSGLQMSREGLLRAILHQVLRGRSFLWHEIFDAKCRSVFKSNRDREKTLEERLSKPVVEWSWTELQNAFEIFASRKPPNLKVFLLIDGLDEFRLLDEFSDYLEYEDDEDSAQVERNIEAHKAIAKVFLELSKRQGFKLCLSSRPLQVFEDAFGKFPGFKIQDLTLNDIRRYVDDRLGNHPRTLILSEAEPGRTRAVIRQVSAKASGVFLWVRLVVNILLDALEAGDSIDQLEQEIDKIPPGLRGPRGLYAKMLASVRPKYREQGFALFCRVLAARGLLTILALSFSQDTSSWALECKIGRISEQMMQSRTDEMDRQLKSRCGGLLETVQNPFLVNLRSSAQHKETLDSMAWSVRPHTGIDPVVSFVHRTAVEYLQGPWHAQGEGLRSRMNHTVDLQLIISCLLRIKLIGRTAHVWEIWHAVKDAVFYAKRVEEQAGLSPTALLDNIDVTMRIVLSQGMSAGRPEDFDKDPGYGPATREAREAKRVPVGKICHTSSIWGPQFCCHSASDEGESILTLAIQGELILYLESKVNQHGLGILNRRGRPLLAYAVSPRGNRSALENLPLSDNSFTIKFSSASMIEWLLQRGANPNETCDKQTVWHEALQTSLMEWDPEDDKNKDKIENFCEKASEWANTMTLLVENGADVLSPMRHSSRIPLQYLYPYWTRFAHLSKPIKILVVTIVRKMASAGALSSEFQNITPTDMLGMEDERLRNQLGISASLNTPPRSSRKSDAPVEAPSPIPSTISLALGVEQDCGTPEPHSRTRHSRAEDALEGTIAVSQILSEERISNVFASFSFTQCSDRFRRWKVRTKSLFNPKS